MQVADHVWLPTVVAFRHRSGVGARGDFEALEEGVRAVGPLDLLQHLLLLLGRLRGSEVGLRKDLLPEGGSGGMDFCKWLALVVRRNRSQLHLLSISISISPFSLAELAAKVQGLALPLGRRRLGLAQVLGLEVAALILQAHRDSAGPPA